MYKKEKNTEPSPGRGGHPGHLVHVESATQVLREDEKYGDGAEKIEVGGEAELRMAQWAVGLSAKIV
jgi:hypothetical protein